MTETTASASMPSWTVPTALRGNLPWVVAITLAAALFHVGAPLGPDVSWLITVSERILAGQTLYVDILEPNPPVAGYLYMLPVWLGQVLGVAPEPLVVAYTLIVALLTTGFLARVVERAGMIERPALLWPFALLLVGVAWGEDFAQREHFAVMASLPLIAVLALRAQGTRPATWAWVLAGLCGGFILAVKPHFALVILLPALYLAWRRRSIRAVLAAPEFWLAGALFLAFLALIGLAFPAFFTKIVPVATATYVADRRDLFVLLGFSEVQLFLGMAAVVLLLYRRKLADYPVLGLCFCCAFGFFLAFFAQSRGFFYQIWPGITLMTVVLTMAFAGNAKGRDRLLGTAIATVCALVVASVPIKEEIRARAMRAPFYAALQAFGPDLAIANVTPDLTATSPLHRVVHGRLINSPPGLLMAMSAIRLRVERQPTGAWAEAVDAVERGERAQLLADMQRQPPDILVTAATGFDWLAWARADPELAALLDDFEPFATIPYDTYDLRLMKRKGLVARP